jgi:integrase/recombinase XerC
MLDKFIDYLQYEKRYSSHTVNAYKSDITEFYDFSEVFYADTPAHQLEFQQLRTYIVYLQESKYSNRTINRKLSSLKSFFKFLFKIGEIKENPSSQINSLKQEKKVMVPFSKEEMVNLLDKFDFGNDFLGVRDKLIIEILYISGIRQSELIGLKLTSFDFSNKTMKVLGKRNKERIIPLNQSIINNLKHYLSLRLLQLGDKQQDSFFITESGKQIYPSLVYSKINYYLSDITKKVKKSPHMLRHTFASHLLDAGADLNSIKELLGHTSLTATQVYTHSSIGKLKKIINSAHPRAKND